MVINHNVLVANARSDWESATVVREELADWLVADVNFASFEGGRGTSQIGGGDFGLGWVDCMPWELWTMWPLSVSADSGKYFAAFAIVRPGQVSKLPALMALSQVNLTEKSAAAYE